MRTNYHNGDETSLPHNGCDGCTPAIINGYFCHENGCADSWKDTVVECFECGCDFSPEERYQRVCADCCGQ